MKLDFTPIYIALGIGAASYFYLRLKKVKSPIKFNDVVYDQKKDEMKLVVENTSGKPVYVKPSLRLVKLTPVSEWREKTTTNGEIPMMSASAGSVIKGYELIGEYAEAVYVAPNTTCEVAYPVRRDFGLKAFDNIKIDSSFGTLPSELQGNTTATVRMNLREFLPDEGRGQDKTYLNEEDDKLQDMIDTLEELIHEASSEFDKEGVVDQVVKVTPIGDIGKIPFKRPEPSKDLIDEEKDVISVGSDIILPVEAQDSSGSPQVLQNEYPIESICFCCGKKQWLNWIVGGDHVCSECRDYLVPGFEEQGSPEDSVVTGFIDDSGTVPTVDEVVVSDDLSLKPRHENILGILAAENTLSAKDMARKLERKSKNVTSDLRHLMNSGLVERVKIGRQYKYFAVDDEGD
ncbi:hypothetical protein ACFLRF_05805 [Candidatus Altiarchaeota archaeon]